MMAKTHIAFAYSVALLPVAIYPELLNNTTAHETSIAFLGLTLGALLPDIDEPNSKISRSSFVTFFFSWFLIFLGNKHRGITHKFIFFLVFLSIPTIGQFTNQIENGTTLLFFYFLSLGVLAHHLGDMMVGGGKNKGGIYNYFSPFYKNNKTTKFLPYILRCKINGLKEYGYLLIFTLFNIAVMANSALIKLTA